MVDNVWNQEWNTKRRRYTKRKTVKVEFLNKCLLHFLSKNCTLHSQHRQTSRSCLAGWGRPSTNQTDQGFVCHRDASGGNRTAFIIRKTGDVIWIQPWCKLSLLVIEMRRRSCCWLRRWRMPLVTTSDRPLSTCCCLHTCSHGWLFLKNRRFGHFKVELLRYWKKVSAGKFWQKQDFLYFRKWDIYFLASPFREHGTLLSRAHWPGLMWRLIRTWAVWCEISFFWIKQKLFSRPISQA